MVATPATGTDVVQVLAEVMTEVLRHGDFRLSSGVIWCPCCAEIKCQFIFVWTHSWCTPPNKKTKLIMLPFLVWWVCWFFGIVANAISMPQMSMLQSLLYKTIDWSWSDHGALWTVHGGGKTGLTVQYSCEHCCIDALAVLTLYMCTISSWERFLITEMCSGNFGKAGATMKLAMGKARDLAPVPAMFVGHANHNVMVSPLAPP